jgi:hypothetical protein
MFLARRTRAPRCERCGRVTAPYSFCLRCSSLASAAADDAAADASIEAMIAAALPEPSPAEEYQAEPPVGPVFVPSQSDLEPLGLDHYEPDGEYEPEGEPYVEAAPGYDPEDVAIPRDPDLFVGAGGRWRRIF